MTKQDIDLNEAEFIDLGVASVETEGFPATEPESSSINLRDEPV